MPLYELFCLARPALTQAHKSEILKAAATSVLGSGGVLTDLKNFGERRLAYPIRRQGVKLEEVPLILLLDNQLVVDISVTLFL